jgi:hypothetical protein
MNEVMPGVDWDKVVELSVEMEKKFDGYTRLEIAFACQRCTAAMFGPAEKKSRELWLKQMPDYMRSMWRFMDEICQ